MDLVFSREARTDIRGIWIYISKDGERRADRVVAKIEATCRIVASQPGIGDACDHYRPGLRRISSGWYVIFFRPDPGRNEVEIVRVLHGARDIDSLFPWSG